MSSQIAVDYAVSYLAGEEKKRPIFLRNLVLKSVLMNESVGSAIVPAYLNGHYFRNKRYLKWVAKPDGYNDAVGLGPLMVLAPMSGATLATIAARVQARVQALGLNPDNHAFALSNVQVRQIAAEDYADQYIRQHRPELANRNYSVEITNAAATAFAVFVAPEGQPAPLLPNPSSGVQEMIAFSKADAKVGQLGTVAYYTLQSKPPAPSGQPPFMQGSQVSHPGNQTAPYSPSAGFVWDGQEFVENTGSSKQQKRKRKFWQRDSDNHIVEISNAISNNGSAPVQRVWRDYRKVDSVHAFDADYPDDIVTIYDVERIGYEERFSTSEWVEVSSTHYAGKRNNQDGVFYEVVYERPKATFWFKLSGKVEAKALHAEIAKVFIYPINTGDPTLDAAMADYTTATTVDAIASPPRPLVINHARIDELGDTINVGHRKHHINTPWAIIRKAANNYTGNDPNPAHKLVNMATRKQTQKSVRKILKELVNHPQFDDMSYVYYFDGVPINSKRKHLCRYVYEYFRGFASAGFDVNDRVNEILDYNNKVAEYYAYLDAVEAKARGTASADQIAIADGPQVLPPEPLSKGKTTEIRWGKDNDFASWIHYSLAMRGEFGAESVISGTQHNPYFNRPAKPREAWITTANHAIKDASKLIGHVGADVTNFYYQEDSNTCRTFSVVNLEFEKWVWRWGYVITTAAEAMEDPDESKFFCLILNQPLKTIGIVPATQVLVESPMLEIDIYVQKRQKFGFKQLIGFIIGVIVSVFFPPAGGYYFGMTGIWGAVVTTAVNVVVGAVIAAAAAKIFGGTLGAIIGALVTMYTMNVMAGGTANFAQMMSDSMGNIQTWTKLSDAIATAFRQHALEKLQKMQSQFESFLQEVKEDKGYIDQLEREAGLQASGGVDAQAMMRALNTMFWGESPEAFLKRTQSYGHEMLQDVLDFVNRFTDNRLALH